VPYFASLSTPRGVFFWWARRQVRRRDRHRHHVPGVGDSLQKPNPTLNLVPFYLQCQKQFSNAWFFFAQEPILG